MGLLLRQRLEPGGRVHRVAQRGVLDAALAAEVADHRLAEMQADAGLAERRQAGVHLRGLGA